MYKNPSELFTALERSLSRLVQSSTLSPISYG